MIQFTNLDGFTQNIDGADLISVSANGNGSVLYVEVAGVSTPYYATQSVSTISTNNPYAVPVVIVEGGSSYTNYLNPLRYAGIQEFGSNRIVLYDYLSTVSKSFETSTSLATLIQQQASAGVYQSTAALYISTDSYTLTPAPASIAFVIYGNGVLNQYKAGVTDGWTYNSTTGVLSYLAQDGSPLNFDDTTQLQIFYI